MSQQANPTIVGAFVLGATILAVGGLAVFGGGRFFTEKDTYVAFFDEEISGLSTGAPVDFRGVKVGEVSEIQVHLSDDFTVRIPVYMELQRGRIREANDDAPEGDIVEKLISRGLRAQLYTPSFVTGKLQIQLDIDPDATPPDRDPDFLEMPTIPSNLARVKETIESLSLEELVVNAQQVVSGLNKLVNSPDLAGSLAGLNQGIRDLQSLVTSANRQIDPLARRFEGTLDEADKTLRSLQLTLASARNTLDVAADSLSIASEESTLRYELAQTLEEMASAARSIRVLAEYLERNPDSLWRGKPGE